MIKILLFIFLVFSYNQYAAATCTYGRSTERIAFNFKNVKLLADTTLPAGTVLAVKKVGGNVASMRTFSNCGVNDVYAVLASGGATEVPGVKGVQGGTVYESGIPGIGFQISDARTGTNMRPIPAKIGTVPAQGLSSEDVEQITVWLIKTKDVIQPASNSSSAVISFSAGPANQISKNDYLLLQVNINFGPFTYRLTSCNVTPRNGGTVTLLPVQAKTLRSSAPGTETGKQKDIYIDISCPQETIGKKYIYWFNPITINSSSANGILLNSINTASGGASGVGYILRMANSAIKFYDYSSYKFASIKSKEEIKLTVDYYKLSSTAAITAGKTQAIFEIILQEE